MMLVPIQYHSKKYPDHIRPEIDEVAGHFDATVIRTERKFSLHTEYSYGARKLDSGLIKHFPEIIDSTKNGVPQLWRSEKWAIEFVEFIKSLCNSKSPEIIEIHPPFSDYTKSINRFLEIYREFESKILSIFPLTTILLENRTGSVYKGGKFIITNGDDLRELCELISLNKLQLRLALDSPQLLTSCGGPQNLNPMSLSNILNRQNAIQGMTKGIHLWGKRKNAKGRTVSHAGDLNSYFENQEKKEIFLQWLNQFLGDGIKRYFVPEVNSSEDDLSSIIHDLENIGIKFG